MKREKPVEELDIISNLPDHIIAHIISFLPTEEAIRTSILSSRWKYLWKGINSILLEGNESNLNRFANLVEHVLDNCRSTNFLSIKLSCQQSPDNICLSRINAWISTVLSCNVEKLVFYFWNYFPDLPAPPLPTCILDCSTLIVLKLDSYFDLRIPESVVCFPHIKSLGFHVILPNQERVMHQLLSSCPVLEELSLSGLLDSGNVRKINISIPTLKKLRLCLEYSKEGEYDVLIDTPNLEYLYIEDDSFSRFVVKNLSRLHHVEIMYEAVCIESLEPKHINRLLELLKGVAAADVMTLHFPTASILGSALRYTWPTFPYLTMLKMNLTDTSGWTCFPRVLHSAPNLKVLILDLGRMNWEIEAREPCPWTPPDNVPLCLLENLQIIGVKWFAGFDDEVQALQYLLKDSQVLKRVLIHPCPYEETVNELLMCPRASGTCDFQFCEEIFFKTSRIKITVWGI
ncbi:hypothetical protein SOVF_023670 [Spinacia oleracea]|uniref:FBD-associated F-box protein At5g60610 n=1 Tax=Spinacia oleracea TaxID=3562 RepID=A0A9R0I593_SPIOL|nr:FBD-associated F-box protein At5g60610-like [Spinacia oleracea]XP_056683089.1 FBD-associated F-box protein At5g60610-like [Spinacia oleracea]XP_056683093.1 FBD-associated F-box protein At5g60610-like [Spinacia oleracea]KNA23560.1 hypothetical protein SOVF_023670 [Spinacia oleracea]